MTPSILPSRAAIAACGLLFAAHLAAASAARGPSLAAAPAAAPAAQEAPGPAVLESDSCALCHSNVDTAAAMRDARGRGVSPYDLWAGTMMANSTRDPLWRAAVSAEVAANPEHRAMIEAECLRCHAPMAHHVGLDEHDTGTLMHVLDCDARIGDLARDGVSCTICHGIAPDGLGTPATESGHFRLNDEMRLFGPYAAPFENPMRMHTGFTPTHGEHVTESALCGSCHTLETTVFDTEGQPRDARFLEQAPYLEWRNSDFRDEGEDRGPRAASCQHCHLPRTDDAGAPLATRIARNPMGFDFPPLDARTPFGRHVLVGGNTLVLGMLRDHAEELRVRAPDGAVEAALEATRRQLRHDTASISLDSVERAGRSLSFTAAVVNRTGHKLPTAHPTRRAWLRAIVRSADGSVVFASGAVDAAGRILGAGGRPLPSERAGGPIEPHRDVVRAADEVATYQAVPADVDGRPTHTLLRAASWYVDDRLLPAGWSAEHPEAARTAPVGTAADADFIGGGDRVHYTLELPDDVTGPVSIEVALLYQPLSARWAAELFRWETAETERFRRMYEAADRTPEILTAATATE